MWEMRGEPRHHLSSKVLCWTALDRAVKLAPALGGFGKADEWAAERDRHVKRSPAEARDHARRMNQQNRERAARNEQARAALRAQQAKDLAFARAEADRAKRTGRSTASTRADAQVAAGWKRAFEQIRGGRA